MQFKLCTDLQDCGIFLRVAMILNEFEDPLPFFGGGGVCLA